MAFVLLALGCGGRAESQLSVDGGQATGGAASAALTGSIAGGASTVDVGSTAGSSGSVSMPGVGPIDATGLPTELPIDCAGMTSPPQLVLPCKIGGSLTGAEGPGSSNVLECYDLAGGTAVASIIPFGNLPTLLNQPVQLGAFPRAPGAGIKLSGTAVFSQVDSVGRAFIARLTGGEITWTGANDQTLTCTIADTPFWAVQGGFI